MSEPVNDREQGIQAIIDLQAAAGITEPRDRAARNWDAFRPSERVQTMTVHKLLFPEKYGRNAAVQSGTPEVKAA